MAGNVRDILINLLGRETISKASDKAERGLGKLGDQMDETADDARRLDVEIDKAEGALRDLARQYARTQDAAERLDLTKAMRKQQTEVRRLTKVRGLLPDNMGAQMGADLAGDVGVSFMARLGPVLARAPMPAMNPAVAAIGAPIVAGLVTLIGAGVGSAVVGGVGLGGVAGGIALAARDPEVKAAASRLADEVGSMLERAAAPMVPATIGALHELRAEAKRTEPEMTRLFAGAARLTPIVTKGLVDTVHNLLPGLVDAVESAGPAVHSIMRGVAGIGDAIGDGLSDLSEYADEGARALSVLLSLVEGGTRLLFGFLKVTSELYSQGEILSAFLSGDLSRGFALIADREANAAERAQRLAAGLGDVGDAAGDASGETKALVAALDQLNGIQLSVNDAERAFQQSIDAAREAFDKKVSSIDLGTERGRTYSEALDSIATSAKTSAQAIFDQTQSTSAANAKIEEGRQALYRQARQYGLSEAAAWAYVDSVLSIPREWTTKLDANTAAAIREIRSYSQWLANIPRTVRTRMIVEQQSARGGFREFSAGGPVTGGGPKGVDSVPAVLAPGEHVLTAAEVDRAGGHAAIERMRALLRGGGSPGPFGGSVVPAGTAPVYGGGRQVVERVHRIVIDGTGVLAGLRKEIRLDGGDVIEFWGGK
jgi:hypothetical protein